MGQYYDLINFDKKILLTAADHPSSKLCQYHRNKVFQDVLVNKLAIDWKGDTVILLGDYADQAENGTKIFRSVQRIRNKYRLPDSAQE